MKSTINGEADVINLPQKYKCKFCEYITTDKRDFPKHSRACMGERPFKCEKCLRSFAKEIYLKFHMKTHATEFPFHCSSCRQGFQLNGAKETHEMYCNVKRYECYLCKHNTYLKHNLFNHMLSHTGDRPFRCCHCSMAFTRNGNLNRHVNRFHNKNK